MRGENPDDRNIYPRTNATVMFRDKIREFLCLLGNIVQEYISWKNRTNPLCAHKAEILRYSAIPTTLPLRQCGIECLTTAYNRVSASIRNQNIAVFNRKPLDGGGVHYQFSPTMIKTLRLII